MTFRCLTCGDEFNEFSWGYDEPDPYANLSEAAKKERAVISTDQCIIDQSVFFIRGCLEIPIVGTEEPLVLGMWASVTKKSFDRIDELWEADGKENESPFKGRLANGLKFAYPDVFNLKAEVRLQPRGSRPQLFVQEPNHPLAIDQYHGISLERALLIASRLMHPK